MHGQSKKLLVVGVVTIAFTLAHHEKDGGLHTWNTGRLEGNVFRSVNMSVFQQCQELCQYSQDCDSVNWNFERRLCQLMKKSETGDQTVQQVKAWVHLHVDTQIKRKVCFVNACAAGRLCVPVFGSGFFCVTSFPGQAMQSSVSRHELSTPVKQTAEHLETLYSFSENLESSMSTAAAVSTNVELTYWNHESSLPLTTTNNIEITVLAASTTLLGDILPASTSTPSDLDTGTTLEGSTAMCVQGYGSGNCKTQTEQSLVQSPGDISCISTTAVVTTSSYEPTLQIHTTRQNTPTSKKHGNNSASEIARLPKKMRETARNVTFSQPKERAAYTPTQRKVFLRYLKSKFGDEFNCSNFQMPFKEISLRCRKNMVRRDGGDCQCKTGLHYNPRTDTCVRSCDRYGSQMMLQSRLICIAGHNNKVIPSKTVQGCISACVAMSEFVCRSFDYWAGKCHLSVDTAADIEPRDWSPWCGCLYFQRVCSH